MLMQADECASVGVGSSRKGGSGGGKIYDGHAEMHQCFTPSTYLLAAACSLLDITPAPFNNYALHLR